MMRCTRTDLPQWLATGVSQYSLQKRKVLNEYGHTRESDKKYRYLKNAILHQSGVSFFRIFTAYRKEKKYSHGKNRIREIISRRAFWNIKKEKVCFQEKNWKFLMHRIGIVQNILKSVVSRKRA